MAPNTVQCEADSVPPDSYAAVVADAQRYILPGSIVDIDTATVTVLCSLLRRALAVPSPQPVELGPIEYDKGYDRYYIPVGGGWEIQTKGKGSTFRLASHNDDDRLGIPDSPYLHETLEKMARAIHATPRAPEGGDEALALIAAERRRHTAAGWTPEHDDQHDDGSLGFAAASYAHSASKLDGFRDLDRREGVIPPCWPWSANRWKPSLGNGASGRTRELVKAGALIVAEIERLRRAAPAAISGPASIVQPVAVSASVAAVVGEVDENAANVEAYATVLDEMAARCPRTADSFNLATAAELIRGIASTTHAGGKCRLGGEGIDIDAMVNRFLGWRLPNDFAPDAGIQFTPSTNPHGWPVGTNLLTAVQAKAMFEYATAPPARPGPAWPAGVRCAGRAVQKSETEKMRVKWVHEGRQLWHEDCANHFGGIMKEVEFDGTGSVLECLSCNKLCHFPKGAAPGSHCCEVIARQPKERDSE